MNKEKNKESKILETNKNSNEENLQLEMKKMMMNKLLLLDQVSNKKISMMIEKLCLYIF